MSNITQIRTKKSNRGFAMLTAILLVVLVAGLGAAMMTDAVSGARSNGSFRSRTQAYYIAKAGLEEGRARIPAVSGSPITPPATISDVVYIVNGNNVDPTRSGNAYYDREYAGEFSGVTPAVRAFVASVQAAGSNLPYRWVRITMKTEASSLQDINRDGVFDSTTPVYYDGTSENLTATGNPVYKITALAVLPGGIRSMLQIEGSEPPPYSADAAVASQDDVRLLGNFSISGTDYCGQTSTTYALKTTGSININGHSGTLSGLTGPSPNPTGTYQDASATYDIVSLINSLAPYSTPIQQVDPTVTYKSSSNTYSGSNVRLGVPPPQPPPSGNNGTPVITYAAGNLELTSSNSQGDGILIVDGDLNVSGGLYYYGLIVVRGVVSFTGGGGSAVNIYGSIVSGSSITNSATVGGGVNVQYDSCAIQNPYQALPLKILAFRTLKAF